MVDDDHVLDIGVGEKRSREDKKIEDLVEIERATAGDNVVPAGAEAKAGQEFLPPGIRFGPAQIALAARRARPA